MVEEEQIPAATPTIILVAPQLGENIGSAARVMGNFGLRDLRLVAPRDGWPNPAADTMSAGAIPEGVVDVTVVETLEEAITDLNYLLATTARPRGMEKPVYDAAEGITALKRESGKTGVLFGAEKFGLPNEAVVLADAILTYPVKANFASLNLGMAVGVFAHAWAADTGVPDAFARVDQPAPREDLVGMFEHLEVELERAGYFFPPEKKGVMTRNIRNAFTRGRWTTQEVRTFRGVLKALTLGRGKARVVRED